VNAIFRGMRLRFFCAPIPPPKGLIELSGDELRHARVTRLREAEEVELFDGKGGAARGRAVSVSAARVTIEVEESISGREAPLHIELAMALIQNEKFELVLQKACELGAVRIIPLITARSEVRLERTTSKQERWRKILQEAVKQSGRSAVPALDAPTPFASALVAGSSSFFFDADEPPSSLPHSVSSARIFIGPEGGWSTEEIKVARDAGAYFQTIGPRRLRAETAAIAAMVIVGARYGDLS